MSADAIKKTYSRSLEIWNTGNLTVIDELYAPGYIRHKMSMPDIKGPEGLKQFVSGLRTSYPDFQVTAEESLVEGSTVVLRGLWQGTQTGPSPTTGAAASGKFVSVPYCTVAHLEDGKVAEEWEYSDWLGFLQQLGIIPPLGQGKE
jgi:steroid delta-isomerase-like uncharacterized protein